MEGDLVRFEDGLHTGGGGDDVGGAGGQGGVKEEPRVVLELLEADGGGHGWQGGEGGLRKAIQDLIGGVFGTLLDNVLSRA